MINYFMPNNKTDALNFLRREGPVQPSQLANELNTNILFASAILSELVSTKEAKITSVKKGGSPFYYVKGQEFENLEDKTGKLQKELAVLKEIGAEIRFTHEIVFSSTEFLDRHFK